MRALYATTTTAERASQLGIEQEALGEYDYEHDLHDLGTVLLNLGCKLINLGLPAELPRQLQAHHPQFVWNLNSGLFGNAREAHAPAILEAFGIRCRGANTWLSVLTQDKLTSQKLVESLSPSGVRTLPSLEVTTADHIKQAQQHFVSLGYEAGLVLKPRFEGSSRGLFLLRDTRDAIAPAIPTALQRWGKYLAQPFVEGTDWSVNFGLNENGTIQPYSPLPLRCEGGLDTATMKTIAVGRSPYKHIEHGRSFCPKVAADMLACARYLEPDLYLRSDLRQCSKSGDFFFLEFNATPTLSRDDDYIKSAELCGLSFETVVARIASQCFDG